MSDPARAGRLWAVVSPATPWPVEVGGLAEFGPRPETVPPLGRVDRPRLHRLFRVGLAVIVAGRLGWGGSRRSLPPGTPARARADTDVFRGTVLLGPDLPLKALKGGGQNNDRRSPRINPVPLDC